MNEQLELAINLLKRRAISTEKVNNKLLKQCTKVISLSDVEAILGMVKNDEFLSFYEKMKSDGHPHYI